MKRPAEHHRLDFTFSDAFVPLMTLANGSLGELKVWLPTLRVWLLEKRTSRVLSYERLVNGAWVPSEPERVSASEWGEVRVFLRTRGANSAAPSGGFLRAALEGGAR